MSDVDFEQVTTRAGLRAWSAVTEVAQRHDYVDLPADPPEDSYPLLDRAPLREKFEFWSCLVGRRVVAVGNLRLPLLDNLDVANVELQVLPDARRRGYGRALASALLDRARHHGRTRALFEVAAPLDPAAPSWAGQEFADGIGARVVLEDVRSRLDLDGLLSPAQLDARIEDVERLASGYHALTWTDRAPSDLLPDLARLAGGMSTDSPLGDLAWQPEVWSPELYRDIEELSRERGRTRVTAAAVENSTGRAVGLTVIGVNRFRPEIAQQSETIVAGAHRGHRLGLLLKLANLRQLRDAIPESRAVITWNAAVNTHMLAINDELGFVPVDRWQERELTLD